VLAGQHPASRSPARYGCMQSRQSDESLRTAIAAWIAEAHPKLNSPILLERTQSPWWRIVAGQEPQFQSMPEFFGELDFLERGYVRRRVGIWPILRRDLVSHENS